MHHTHSPVLSAGTDRPEFFNKTMRTNSDLSESSDDSYSLRYRDSFSSAVSSAGSMSAGHKFLKKQARQKNKNVYTKCGRHTDQFLFDGPSLSGLVKALFSRH
ncbi:hypothetical protein BROUX41_002470 [Berkeleyomyces rouxiae]